MEASAEPPRLADPEIVARAHAGTLPARWRVELTSAWVRPSYAPGDVLTVARGPARRGAIACVVAGERLAYRRVLRVDGHAALLRAEVAPFADGWFVEVVGCVVAPAPRPLARLAARAPVAWTTGLWLAANGLAWVRGARARVAAEARRWTRRDAAVFAVRPLDGANDVAAYCAFRARVQGLAADQYRPRPGDTTLALYTASDRRPIGAISVTVGSDGAYCHSLVVDPAWRGSGGGTRLARAAVAVARAASAHRAWCYVHARNRASLATFVRAGFVPTGQWWRSERDAFAAAEYQKLELAANVNATTATTAGRTRPEPDSRG